MGKRLIRFLRQLVATPFIRPTVYHVYLAPNTVFGHQIKFDRVPNYVQIENYCPHPVAVRLNADNDAILWLYPDCVECFWETNLSITHIDFSAQPDHQGGPLQVIAGVIDG